MLPKSNRVVTKEVEDVFKHGKIITTPSFTFRYLPQPKGKAKISCVAPKTVAKLAVDRNLLRRRGYAMLRKYLSTLPPLTGVLVFKRSQKDPSIFKDEIQTIFNKIN